MSESCTAKHKSISTLARVGLFATWIFFTGSGDALTLGNLQGAALVGRALSVAVPVQLDVGDLGSSVCAEVEVSFAENLLDSVRVRSSWQMQQALAEGVLRIETTVAVDEPVVGIQVRAGCVRKTVRKYVLLADLPGDSSTSAIAEPPMAPAAGAAVTVAKTNAVPVVRAIAIEVLAGVKSNPKPAANPKPASKPSPVKAQLSSFGAATVPAQSAKTPNASRLLLADANVGLKSTLEMVTMPTEDSQARADAQTLWRSLNASTEELAKDAQKRQALEAQVKALQSDTSKNRQAQDALKSQLAKAEEERYANALVGVLAALLLCALAGVGYLVFRMRKGHVGSEKSWWRSESSETSVFSDMASIGTTERSQPRSKDSQAGRSNRLPAADAGLDESLFNKLSGASGQATQKARWQPAASGFMSPQSGFFNSSLGIRSVNVEELFDIQQQAEFFVSLGQHEQAITLLQHHIGGTHNTSGLVYLDLLQLYHQFNRRTEYDKLREEFNSAFNAQVPTFENNVQQGRGIERYGDSLARLQAAWQSPTILDVLHDLIFRKPEAGEPQGGAFDLTAYRELMLLFAIAKDLTESSLASGSGVSASARRDNTERTVGHSMFTESLIGPVDLPQRSTGDRSLGDRQVVLDTAAAGHTIPVQPIKLPKPSAKLGLDVDLLELEKATLPVAETDIGLDLDFSLPLAQAPAPATAPNTDSASDEGVIEFDIDKYAEIGKEFSAGLKIKAPKG